jgi:hypothetical protein
VTFLVVLAGILAVGVIYNGARIALAERGRELASLRVLGFTRREVTGAAPRRAGGDHPHGHPARLGDRIPPRSR